VSTTRACENVSVMAAPPSRVRASVYRRLMVIQLLDALAWVIAVPFMFVLRYEGFGGFRSSGAPVRVVVAVVLAAGVSALVAAILVERRGRPIAGSFEDVRRLVECNAVGGAVLLVVNSFTSSHLIPNSSVVGSIAVATLLSMTWRGALRMRRERARAVDSDAKRAIVFGAGDGGIQLVDSMLHDPNGAYVPVAVLDDDRHKHVLSIRGVRVVGGRESLAWAAERFGASVVIIAVPSAASTLVRDVASLATNAGLEVRVLPPISELFDHTVGAGDIREVTDVDLLGRSVIDTDLDAAANLLSGKRIMVTGAGGSIGAEIARQVFQLNPAELILLDRDESSLHALQLELEGRALLDTRNLVIADIRDRDRVFDVMREHRPDVVFHAAALKHLPLLEMHPTEAVKSNVFGTKNVLDAAGSVSVGHFVNISTDKAADPTSALGASKRLAEGLTSSAGEKYDGTFISVRFGNVLGSRGTALDTFRAQIAAGGPVTVTDPEVTRFFMTVSEAVQLVLQAATFGGDGEVMVLDMGEPVRIADIAMQLASQAPRPIEIVYTGLRPGEKLHEVLFGGGEQRRRGRHPLIFHVQVPAVADATLDSLVTFDEGVATMTMLALVRDMAESSPSP
jgi:FlaA1/EpsC-like NDP-sugar epimerase